MSTEDVIRVFGGGLIKSIITFIEGDFIINEANWPKFIVFSSERSSSFWVIQSREERHGHSFSFHAKTKRLRFSYLFPIGSGEILTWRHENTVACRIDTRSKFWSSYSLLDRILRVIQRKRQPSGIMLNLKEVELACTLLQYKMVQMDCVENSL